MGRTIDEGHTPGPWEYDNTDDTHVIRMGSALNHAAVYEPQHLVEWRHGLSVEDEDDFIQWGEAESNACLIAAAPDLLEACKGMVRMFDAVAEQINWAKSFLSASEIQQMVSAPNAAKAAIAKATGEEAEASHGS